VLALRTEERLRLLPYALPAAYLCRCGRLGDCEGWTLRLGIVYHPGVARAVLEGREPPICEEAVELLEKLGDPRLYQLAAGLHYAAIAGIDASILPGFDEEAARRAAEALREAGLLPPRGLL